MSNIVKPGFADWLREVWHYHLLVNAYIEKLMWPKQKVSE